MQRLEIREKKIMQRLEAERKNHAEVGNQGGKSCRGYNWGVKSCRCWKLEKKIMQRLETEGENHAEVGNQGRNHAEVVNWGEKSCRGTKESLPEV